MPVRLKPMQRDLFTGELVKDVPKAGDGKHIKLHGSRPPAVRGMASFAGEGPEGSYCRDCAWYGEIRLERPDASVEGHDAGCVKWAQRMGHAKPTQVVDISLCRSCKHFEASSAMPRRYIVWMDGRRWAVLEFPLDLQKPTQRHGKGNTVRDHLT